MNFFRMLTRRRYFPDELSGSSHLPFPGSGEIFSYEYQQYQNSSTLDKPSKSNSKYDVCTSSPSGSAQLDTTSDALCSAAYVNSRQLQHPKICIDPFRGYDSSKIKAYGYQCMIPHHVTCSTE